MPAPINDFKPFGIGPGDDATSQTAYESATWRIEGWRSGILPHEQINKVLRQTSVIASAMAQTVADFTQLSVLDDGDYTTVVNRFKQALSAYLPFNPATTYPPGSIGYAIQNSTGGGGVLTAEALKLILSGQLTTSEFASSVNERLNLIDAPTVGLVTKVADLTGAYGSTASAATSAAAANSSAIAAAAAQNAAAVSAGAAFTSETNASNSRTAASTSASQAATSASQAATSATSAAGSASSASTSASTASTAATNAGTSAAAAATSATNAATSATNAGTSAAAAETSRINAQTQASNASVSAANAASSATTASGAASVASTKADLAANSESAAANSATAAANQATVATTQAGVATTQAGVATTQAIQAATSASNASSSATAAAGSASSALTSSNAAGSSAAAAASSSVSAAASASAAAAALGQTARANMVYRLMAATPAPGDLDPTDISWGLSAWGFRIVGNGLMQVAEVEFGTAFGVPLYPNTAYSLSFKAKLTAGSGSVVLGVDFYPDTLPETTRTVTTAEQEFKWENVSSSNSDWATSPVYMRFFKDVPTGTTLEITDIKLEQNTACTPFVLNPRDVTYYAQAAATSASSAAASAAGANTSATAAQSARVAAESAQGAASSSATQAANSASSAAGSASTATSQATQAANSATAAAGSASASNTSATSAATQATNAANSASAAATWYNQTVAATGTLTASVTALQTAVAGPNGLQAQYALKVVATRPDGKKVFGYMGLQATAPNDNTGGQSEILMAADRLVFVPISDPNAGPVQPFVVGVVNGVTTLIVNQAVIGDNIILPRSINTPNLAALSALLGSVRIDASGQLIMGMSAYGVGSGICIGYDAGEYSLIIGDKTAAYLEYKPSTGLRQYNVQSINQGGIQPIGNYRQSGIRILPAGSGTATAKVEFRTDGSIWGVRTQSNGVNAMANLGSWFTPVTTGIGAGYEILLEVLSNDGGTLTNDAPNWTSLGGACGMQLTFTSTGMFSYTMSGRYTIRLTSGQQVASGAINLDIDREP